MSRFTRRRSFLSISLGPAIGLAAAFAAPGGATWAQDTTTANGSGAARANAPVLDHAAAPTAMAMRATTSIEIDGRLREAAWQTAQPATGFIQLEPTEGAPASERTEVRIVFDDRALYIAATLYDSGPVSTRLGRRDADLPDSDWFAVALDSHHDHLTAYRFAVNPSGVQRDEVMSGSNTFRGDDSWEPVWNSATTVTDSGWVVEMRIPFSQLRFSRAEVQTWGIQLERRIIRKQEHSVFSYTPRRQRGGVPRYGHLSGIDGLQSGAGKPLEVLPYMVGRADYRAVERNANVSFGNPFRDGSAMNAGFGVDLKYRPSSNLTLDATVNPDFGQVELDPAVINLTAFETRFDEKRPFFVEGADVFRFGQSGVGGMGGGGGGRGGFFGGGGGGGGGGGDAQLVYTRRIGRAPQGATPDAAAYIDRPEATTILGAAKLTGRTASGWSFGVIEALTALEEAPYVDAGQATSRAPVEPLTNYFVGRVRRDWREGQTSLGILGTSVNRDLDDDALAARLRSSAFTGGLDFRHEWKNRTWSASGFITGSRISGTTDAIIAAQRASARYYHRPDADHIEVDSAATSLGGWSAKFEIGKRAGLWQGNASLSAISPGFEVNDLGFQTAADRVSLELNFSRDQTVPGPVFRRYNIRIGPDFTWNFGGDRLTNSIGVGGHGQLANYWGFGYNLTRRFESLDDRLTRGGVLAIEPAQTSGFLFISTDSRKAYTGRFSFNGGTDDSGGWRLGSNITLGLRPASNVSIEIGPNFTRSRTTAQYVTRVTDPTATSTLGRRYVFADLAQTTLGIETRLNLTFNRSLTLEMYAQPFLSTGDYGNLKELTAPASFDFDVYGIDKGSASRANGVYRIDADGNGPSSAFTVNDPDFNLRSLRGSAVLRWEWRPGSALFLVWQQNRSRSISPRDLDAAAAGRFDLADDMSGLFSLRPDNVFMIKATWWWNP